MSDTEAYWAYEAAPGSIAEGRRAFALEQAAQWDDTDEGIVGRALKFEAYLKGEVPVVAVDATEYQELVKRSNRLLFLEKNGKG